MVGISSVAAGILSVIIAENASIPWGPNGFLVFGTVVFISYFLLMTIILFILRLLKCISSLKVIFFTPVTWFFAGYYIFMWMSEIQYRIRH